MLENVRLITRPIEEAPLYAKRLAVVGEVIILWHPSAFMLIRDSTFTKCDLVYYHPDSGWQACNLQDAPREITTIVPASENAFWLFTEQRDAFLFRIVNYDDLEIVGAAHALGDRILFATENRLWTADRGIVYEWYLGEDNVLTNTHKHEIGFDAKWGKHFENGAVVVMDEHKLCMLDASGHIVHEEQGDFQYLSPFFLLSKDDGLYYTENPQLGWQKTPIPLTSFDKAHENKSIAFFARIRGSFYIAIRNSALREIAMYQLFKDLTAEPLWKITHTTAEHDFALLPDGCVCIVNIAPFSIHRQGDTPYNSNGFTIWNPSLNTFHKNPKSLSMMHARHMLRNPLHIPATWHS